MPFEHDRRSGAKPAVQLDVADPSKANALRGMSFDAAEASLSPVQQRADYWRGIEWTADTTVQAWAAVARECVSAHVAGEGR